MQFGNGFRMVAFFLSISPAVTLGSLQLIDTFDHYTETYLTAAALRPPDGTLGGGWTAYPSGLRMWDARVLTAGGSLGLSINTSGSGQGRAAMISGLSDPIETGEKGVLSFRFRISSAYRGKSAATCAFAGLHSLTEPSVDVSVINAGFGIKGPAGSEFLDIVDIKEQLLAKGRIKLNVWYNAWICVDHEANTFDLYIRPAEDNGIGAPLPQQMDRIAKEQRFATAAKKPLEGAMFICPSMPDVTQRFQIDNIYWDGKENLNIPEGETPPSPNPITWKDVPRAVRPTQVTMTAGTANSDYEVEYLFENSSETAHSSGWQISPSWTDKGLSADAQYSYRVKARYRLANRYETGWSEWVSVTTPAETDRQPPLPESAAWSKPPHVIGYNFVKMAAADAVDAEGNSPVQYYFANLTDPTHDSGWLDGPTYTDTQLRYGTEYSYRVKTRDSSGNRNEGRWSPTATIKTSEAFPLMAYLRKSLLRHFSSLNEDVPLHVYYRESTTGEKGAPIIFYVKNHGYPRIGQEKDEYILKDYVQEGYLLITLDFANNPEAVSPMFDADLYDVFRAAHGYKTESFLKGTGLCPDENLYWFVPAGCRLARNILYFELDKHGSYGTREYVLSMWNKHAKARKWPTLSDPNAMYNPDGSPLDWTQRMDIIYPSQPTQKLPLMIWASTQSLRHISPPSAYRPHFWGFLMRGYVLGVTDHCYVPLNRHWAYGHGFDTQYNLTAWNGVKSQTAAIRYLRKYADKYGIDSDHIGLWGHSKGSVGSALLADPNHDVRGETETYKGFACGSPEPQPWPGYSSQITVSYQSMGGGTRNLDLVTSANVPTMIACGRFDQYGEWDRFPPLINAYESRNVNHLAFWMEDIGHDLPAQHDPILDVDRYAVSLKFFDQYLKPDQNPEVLYILPRNGCCNVSLKGFGQAIPDKSKLPANALKYVSFDVPITVHFGQPMDITSIMSGIEVVCVADDTPVQGYWKAFRGDTLFQFLPEGNLRAGSGYRITVKTRAVNKRGKPVLNPRSVKFLTRITDQTKITSVGGTNDLWKSTNVH